MKHELQISEGYIRKLKNLAFQTSLIIEEIQDACDTAQGSDCEIAVQKVNKVGALAHDYITDIQDMLYFLQTQLYPE